MSQFSDDHLAAFKVQSDRAFLEMQQAADREMASFLQKYSGATNLSVGQARPVQQRQTRPRVQAPTTQIVPPAQASPAPQKTPDPQQTPAPQAAPVPQNPKIAPGGPGAAVTGESLYETASGIDFGSLNKTRLSDSADDLKSDMSSLSANLREESRAAARDALRGTSDIIKGSASDLGKRAKEEAAALRDAAKQAMEEERSLKAMKGRAASEARKAKARVKEHLEEAKDEAVDNLQELAKEKFGSLRSKAMDAFETGQEAIQRELGDLASGKDSPSA